MGRIGKKLLKAVFHLLLDVGKGILSIPFGHSDTNPSFPPKVLKKMQDQGITKDDVLDVYFHGEPVPGIPGMMIRKYEKFGYKIGLTYTRDKKTGGYVILSAWKRPRKT